MLNDPLLPRIAVTLRDGIDVGTAAPIFADLAADSLLYDSGSLTIQGENGRGRVPTVEYGSSASPAALLKDARELSIDPGTVTKLTLSSCLLNHLVAVWPSLPSVLELEIIVGNADTEECTTGAPMAPTSHFPAAREVRLLGEKCTNALSEQEVVDLLRRLRLHLPLAALTIDHRVFEGPHSALAAVARSVFVGVFYV